MIDYLNLMFTNPQLFFEEYMKDPNILSLNTRRQEASDGNILHLVVKELLSPSINTVFDDNDALRLVIFLTDNGACTLIENSDRKIPYELFEQVYRTELCFRYKTYRYLLSRTCDVLMEGRCSREFYDDREIFYEFDRAYV